MKLDILVPQYKETDEVIKPLLDSIAIQQLVNFNDVGVIIVNDGSDVFLTEDFLKSYPFKITYIKNEHKGVSATRQKALDSSKADYVMFCDADDMFCHVCGLWVIFNEMEIGFDSLVSVFMEETKMQNEKHIFINREQDATFVHGKVHRRRYLLEQNIRWNENLTIHEDSYFNILCQRLSNNVKYCTTPFYLWRWRDESICRSDFKYILKTYNNMLDSNTALVKEFLKRGRKEEACFYATMMIYDAYFTMNKDEWINQDNKEYRDATEKRFADYYKEFGDFMKQVPIQVQGQILQGLKNRFFNEGMFLEKITFDDWIKHVEETYLC